MRKVINILKDDGFSKMDSCVYANDKGICFILSSSEIRIINRRGDTIEEFRNVKHDSDTNYLIVGFLYAKGWLKEDYRLPKEYQIN
ncbi:hypothetical protein CLV62_12530 [Dysgonomonas alginatilytica]|uniref:Uncharacterized protein n=1 Tax=Dysgonomonas alginatilytica TaxID=1605892 RepID=A0A2V3PS63_9BACT|nr:hypothetical protein [Dysgonomonas alginatilytica]PXV61197.1 hypothetical protein CLV62_12530 [Dysgonomonas alginatilytica]